MNSQPQATTTSFTRPLLMVVFHGPLRLNSPRTQDGTEVHLFFKLLTARSGCFGLEPQEQPTPTFFTRLLLMMASRGLPRSNSPRTPPPTNSHLPHKLETARYGFSGLRIDPKRRSTIYTTRLPQTTEHLGQTMPNLSRTQMMICAPLQHRLAMAKYG